MYHSRRNQSQLYRILENKSQCVYLSFDLKMWRFMLCYEYKIRKVIMCERVWVSLLSREKWNPGR